MTSRRSTSRRAVLRALGTGAAGVTGLAVLGACSVTEAEDKVTIEMTGLARFEPATVTIRRGGRVTWRNAATILHTATCDPAAAQGSYAAPILPQGAEPWDSGSIDPGETWSREFEVPGSFVYFCRFHEDVGMIGTITVTEE